MLHVSAGRYCLLAVIAFVSQSYPEESRFNVAVDHIDVFADWYTTLFEPSLCAYIKDSTASLRICYFITFIERQSFRFDFFFHTILFIAALIIYCFISYQRGVTYSSGFTFVY